jgi:hypothetical protein
VNVDYVLLLGVFLFITALLGLNQIAKNLHRQSELLAEIRDILRTSST